MNTSTQPYCFPPLSTDTNPPSSEYTPGNDTANEPEYFGQYSEEQRIGMIEMLALNLVTTAKVMSLSASPNEFHSISQDSFVAANAAIQSTIQTVISFSKSSAESVTDNEFIQGIKIAQKELQEAITTRDVSKFSEAVARTSHRLMQQTSSVESLSELQIQERYYFALILYKQVRASLESTQRGFIESIDRILDPIINI